MAFDPGKVHKLQDQLESIAYDWMLDRVQSHYGVEEVSELDSDQIQELSDYSQSDECDRYVGMALNSMLDEWDFENGSA
jgi:hypothetical protein|tara:strand:- start:4013 stop:4249 length:237 start_codon:yes stop_codon:yes gene_type:complete